MKINILTIFSGPAQYDNHEFTTFTYSTKPLSKKGYIVGARTDERVEKFYSSEVSLIFIAIFTKLIALPVVSIFNNIYSVGNKLCFFLTGIFCTVLQLKPS